MADVASNVYRQPIAIPAAVAIGNHVLVVGRAGYDVLLIELSLSGDNTQQGVQVATIRDSTITLATLFLFMGMSHVWPESNMGWIRTTVDGSDLNMVLTMAQAVGGEIVYRYVPSHARY